MPFEIRTDRRYMEVTLSGVLTNADLVGISREADVIEGQRSPVPHRITNTLTITRLEIDFGGVLALANERMRRRFPNEFKSAIVAPDAAHFGFARMFQTLNDHPQITIAIFGDEVSALAWLDLPGVDPPEVAWAPVRERPSLTP